MGGFYIRVGHGNSACVGEGRGLQVGREYF